MSEEEFDKEMYEMQKEVLEENRVFLCETIQPSRHYPYLRQQRILNLEGQELIENKITRSGKVSQLVDQLIMSGGPKAFTSFIESLLDDGTQGHVISKLHKALDNKRGTMVRAGKAAINNNTNSDDPREPVENDDDLASIESSEADREQLPGPPLPPPHKLANLRPQQGFRVDLQNHAPVKATLIAHGNLGKENKDNLDKENKDKTEEE